MSYQDDDEFDDDDELDNEPTRDELIAAHPNLTPSGPENGLVLGAKNLRAQLKAAGIKAIVKTARYSGGDSLRVAVLDEDRLKEAEKLADNYRDQKWNSRDESYECINLSWSQTFGSACHTSVDIACDEDEAKMRGTYKAPVKTPPTQKEILLKFLTGAKNGTESVVAKWLPDVLENNPERMVAAWRLAIYAKYKGAFFALAKGADPNIEVGSTTPLHCAANRSTELVELLLSRGADPSAVDYKGKVPTSMDPKIQSLLESARRMAELTKLAQEIRGDDLASPEEVMAQRSRSIRM